MQRITRPTAPEPGSSEAALAAACELHETTVWEVAHRACADLPGNPLRSETLRLGSALATALGSLDFASLNRVIGLGVAGPVGVAELEALGAFYQGARQTCFRVEVAEGPADAGVAETCERVGLLERPEAMAKLILPAGAPVDAPDPAVSVRELGIEHAEAYASVNLQAWGFPAGVGPWFSAPIGVEGFRHFGVVRDGAVVAVGALHVGAGMAWMGFDAALRRYQARGFQRALALHRIAIARSLGCRAVHIETRSERAGAPNPVLRLAVAIGFDYPYDRRYFEPAP